MTHKERFNAVMTGKPYDRMPLYFFGSWAETKQRWVNEGAKFKCDMNDNIGPQLDGMDPDWELGLWSYHGYLNISPFGDYKYKVVDEDNNKLTYQSENGDIVQQSKIGASIPHYIKFGLEPTRESWEHYKTFLNPKDIRRFSTPAMPPSEDRVLPILGGSLYGHLRGYMGVENISYIMYDEPELFAEMVAYMTDYYIELVTPLIHKLKPDLIYIFEDCCGKSGPLFSPTMYYKYFHKNYLRMLSAYREAGAMLIMVDSDGDIRKLLPCFTDSGFDIIFPLEVGTWGNHIADIRRDFGRDFAVFGGVDKRVISQGKDAVYKHLLSLKAEADNGKFLPIPDHRIAPECSYQNMLDYIEVFKEIFK